MSKLERQVALHFRSEEDFDTALERLWDFKKGDPNIQFGSPAVDNVLIIPEKYIHVFDKLNYEKQQVSSSMEGLSEHDVTELRKENLWPRQ